MAVCTSDPDVASLSFAFNLLSSYTDLASYLIRFTMGTAVAIYLFWTRDRRSFPAFVKF